MTKALIKLQQLRSEKGATAVEYGLMVALIAIVIIVAVALLGTNLSGLFNKVAHQRLINQASRGGRRSRSGDPIATDVLYLFRPGLRPSTQGSVE